MVASSRYITGADGFANSSTYNSRFPIATKLAREVRAANRVINAVTGRRPVSPYLHLLSKSLGQFLLIRLGPVKNERILPVVIVNVADLVTCKLFIGKNVLDAVEGTAIGHESAGHGPPPAWCHIGAGTVRGQSVVKGTGTGLHLRRKCHRILPLGIDAKDVADVLADARVLESGRLVAAREKVEAAVLESGIVESDPEAEGLA